MAEPVATSGTNGYAIAALVLGILGITFAPTGPVAVWLGYRARREIEQTGEGGSGLATAGIVLGWIGTVLLALGVVFVVLILVASSSVAHSG